MTTDLILGTAGHIDHGKTALIRALTGVDCDRLPEEKRRGITIDIGFAELDLDGFRLGIVDVPGHERFVRNMLAGATGMDLAMLIIAADESIKPQTREHLEILKLLDLPAGVVVLTKCDLVDSDWIDMVEAEVREFVEGTVLADAPILRVSAITGQGIAALKSALVDAARIAARRREHTSHGPFRMAIDRVFTIAGHGTVVTGSVTSGICRLGDALLVEPGEVPVRVRGLQNHDRTVDAVQRGQRAAINLVGIHHEDVRRGHELSTPGHLVPARVLTVKLSLAKSTPQPLKGRSRVRIHLGTAEILASVVLLDRDRLEPGQTAYVQLLLQEPAVSTWNQPLVVRSESPLRTLGGGRVLDPNARRLRRPDAEQLEQVALLESADPLERASAALFLADVGDWQPADLSRTAGVDDPQAAFVELRRQGKLWPVVLSPTRQVYLHTLVRERLARRVEAALAHLHSQNPLKLTIDRAAVAHGFAYLGDTPLFDAILEFLRATDRVRVTPRGIGLAGHGPKLSQNEQKSLVQLVEQYLAAGVEPPTVKEVQQQLQRNQSSVPSLIALAAADGQLVEIGAGLYLHADVERSVRARLRGPLAEGGLTVGQIRELLGTSRKFAVPICEYLDRIGFTRRAGDMRQLAESLACSPATDAGP